MDMKKEDWLKLENEDWFSAPFHIYFAYSINNNIIYYNYVRYIK